MRTGFDPTQSNHLVDNFAQTINDLIQPVLEEGVVLAGKYATACGRDTLLDKDIEYAMRYCIMYKVGQTTGPLFNYDDIEEDGDEDIEIVDPEECPEFVRYSGDNTLMNQINEAYDRWDAWVPPSPIQELLKSSLDNNEFTRVEL
jgi:hypothetical protein